MPSSFSAVSLQDLAMNTKPVVWTKICLFLQPQHLQDLKANLGKKKFLKEKGNIPIRFYCVICKKVIKRGMRWLDSCHDPYYENTA